jgi:hypothetical protein
VHVVDVRKALSNDARLAPAVGLHITNETVERGPAVEAKTDDLGEEVGGECVIIAAVARFADTLGDASLDEATGLGADAGLADVELLGEGVEGAGLVGQEQGAEEAAGDTGEAVTFGRQSHAFDEGVSVGHGRIIIWNIQYKLNVIKRPALYCGATYIFWLRDRRRRPAAMLLRAPP